jgi:hypothetical protein
VRWLGSDALLVAARVPASRPGEFSQTQLWRIAVHDGTRAPLLAPRRYFNAEPLDAHRFVVGVETNDQGESDLEIWSLDTTPAERVARRAQTLDEPRWSPDARGLVAAMMIDPESAEDEDALAVGGVSVPWPRLHAVEANLQGPLVPIHDGARDEPAAAGGSLPLYWGADGIYARQRAGLARCATPISGCELVFAPPEERRIVDARPLGDQYALALVVDTTSGELNPLPHEIWRIDLRAGTGQPLQPARAGAYPLDLDWSPVP